MGEWGMRASARYERSYAQRYRAADETIGEDPAYQYLAQWLAGLCASLTPPSRVLDFGCGTGRYFSALRGADEIVGLDASDAMLAEARRPAAADRITARQITLVHGDLTSATFERERFQLIYSIGVVAEHVPLTDSVLRNVASWLAPHGAFAFTAVHPESPSIPRTFKRRLGAVALRLAPGPLVRVLRDMWLGRGLYADERRIRELAARAGLSVESVDVIDDVHRHCVAVLRKR